MNSITATQLSLFTETAMKRCSKCGRAFPQTTEYFVRDNRLLSGLGSRCKECNRIKCKTWWDIHPEERKNQNRAYREVHREELNAYNKTYYKAHREERAAYNKTYKDIHREEQKIYRKNHSERIALSWLRRKAKKRLLPNNFTDIDWKKAKAYFSRHDVVHCAYCGKLPGLFYNMRLHKDHYIPLSDPRSDNPGHVAWNIVPACAECNTKKRDRDPHEWLVEYFGKRKAGAIERRIEAYFAIVRPNK